MIHVKADYVGQGQEGIFTFRASTSAVDRQNETIDQAGWKLEDYKRNPVILDSHRYGSIDDILGRARRVEVGPEGLEVDVEFAPTGKGNMARELVEAGMLNTVSVGFRSLSRRPGMKAGEPMTHTGMELLEVSMVAIPANREAVRLRGVEDDVDTTEKAGRKLSKASADKIRAAMAMLAELIDDHFEEMDQAGMKPEDKPKTFVADAAVVAALAAFAKEANNG
jgi:HK97 family phage prohead protease